MKRRISSLFAGLCTILLAAGFTVTFALAWKKGITAGINSLVGFFLSIALAPIFHELGHVIFAKIANMETVYVKCFCFKIFVKNGKRRFSFASPFAPDQTQTIPKKGGNMQSRAGLYTLGGMIVEGITLIVVVALALLWSITGFKNVAFLFCPLQAMPCKTKKDLFSEVLFADKDVRTVILTKSFRPPFSKGGTDPTPWGVGRPPQRAKFPLRRSLLQAFLLRLLPAREKRLRSLCFLTNCCFSNRFCQ